MNKKIKRLLISWLILGMILTLCGCRAGDTQTSGEETTEATYPMSITVLDVGKADVILVEVNGRTMVVDCGEREDYELLNDALKEKEIETIDILLITHFDKDHVGGAADLIGDYEIRQILYPDYEGTNNEYTSFRKAIKKLDTAQCVSKVTELSLGEAQLSIYPATDPESYQEEGKEYDNELSLVMRMVFGSKTFLFGGDVEGKRIKSMLKEDTDWSADWIKIPHHGNYDKQLVNLLDASKPVYAVLTSSAEEPAETKMTEALTERGIAWYDTVNGTVITYTDGTVIEMNQK